MRGGPPRYFPKEVYRRIELSGGGTGRGSSRAAKVRKVQAKPLLFVPKESCLTLLSLQLQFSSVLRVLNISSTWLAP